MRELTFVGKRKVEWRERPDPTVQSRLHAVVKPVASTTCDVDKQVLAGHGPIEPPFAIGHERVAEVVDLGDGVTHIAPGDLVVIPWSISCRRCDRCHAGLFSSCRSVPHMAMSGTPIGRTGCPEPMRPTLAASRQGSACGTAHEPSAAGQFDE